MAIFTTIKNALAAITQIAALIDLARRQYEAWQERKIDAHYEAKKKVLTQTRAKIEVEQRKPTEEQDDEVLRNLQRRLSNMGE